MLWWLWVVERSKWEGSKGFGASGERQGTYCATHLHRGSNAAVYRDSSVLAIKKKKAKGRRQLSGEKVVKEQRVKLVMTWLRDFICFFLVKFTLRFRYLLSSTQQFPQDEQTKRDKRTRIENSQYSITLCQPSTQLLIPRTNSNNPKVAGT